MHIAIIGTRGIPNHYGGFEQFAQYLSSGLVQRGHSVVVYNSHTHPYQDSKYQGVDLLHKYDPENIIGTPGQFVYDLNCILDSRKRSFDIILQLGYTSSSIWSFLFPGNSVIITNMDGLEWKRSKYNSATKNFLRVAEKLAVKHSDYLIADSIGIQKYLSQRYGVNSKFIPYGATPINNPDIEQVHKLGLEKYSYDMLVARLEPENNIETILEGTVLSKCARPIIIIGNHHSTYGEYLKSKFKEDARIKFLGSIYDITVLDNLRAFSNVYYHGHSVGGTNPSLLEAMASRALICAHQNDFNSSILGDDAYYFGNAIGVSIVRDKIKKGEHEKAKLQANYNKILNQYSWEKIISDYERFMMECYKTKKHSAT